MKLALIGVGAIGSIIAANLAKNGVQLYVVEKDKEAYVGRDARFYVWDG